LLLLEHAARRSSRHSKETWFWSSLCRFFWNLKSTKIGIVSDITAHGYKMRKSGQRSRRSGREEHKELLDNEQTTYTSNALMTAHNLAPNTSLTHRTRLDIALNRNMCLHRENTFRCGHYCVNTVEYGSANLNGRPCMERHKQQVRRVYCLYCWFRQFLRFGLFAVVTAMSSSELRLLVFILFAGFVLFHWASPQLRLHALF
jgi:hypothetical protein